MERAMAGCRAAGKGSGNLSRRYRDTGDLPP
jgi:hypothetical protein